MRRQTRSGENRCQRSQSLLALCTERRKGGRVETSRSSARWAECNGEGASATPQEGLSCPSGPGKEGSQGLPGGKQGLDDGRADEPPIQMPGGQSRPPPSHLPAYLLAGQLCLQLLQVLLLTLQLQLCLCGRPASIPLQRRGLQAALAFAGSHGVLQGTPGLVREAAKIKGEG